MQENLSKSKVKRMIQSACCPVLKRVRPENGRMTLVEFAAEARELGLYDERHLAESRRSRGGLRVGGLAV